MPRSLSDEEEVYTFTLKSVQTEKVEKGMPRRSKMQLTNEDLRMPKLLFTNEDLYGDKYLNQSLDENENSPSGRLYTNMSFDQSIRSFDDALFNYNR